MYRKTLPANDIPVVVLCTILNKISQKVTILLLTIYTILAESELQNLEKLRSCIVYYVNYSCVLPGPQ